MSRDDVPPAPVKQGIIHHFNANMPIAAVVKSQVKVESQNRELWEDRKSR